jgi:ubiquinol-cytochrome c reductase cytochrome c1 subunit
VRQATEKGAAKLVVEQPGRLSPAEYDQYVADLVNYLTYMAEPARAKRVQIGIVVLFFLAIFFVITVLLKKEYWKDVR